MLFELVVVLLLVLLNGLFAGAEIALVGIDRIRVHQLAEQGRARARIVQHLRSNPERLFATVQIVITVVGATAGAFGGAMVAKDLAPALVPLAGAHAETAAFAAVVAVISYLSLVLGELVPKSLAVRYAERYALLVAPLLSALASAARPLVWLLTKSSNLVLGAFGDKTTFAESRFSAAELRRLVDQATETGALDHEVGEIASRAFEFARLKASDVMIPRTQIIGLRSTASPEEIRDIVLEYAHSRLPIYSDTLDGIVGYVLYKDLVALAWEGRLIVLADLIRPPFFVSEAMPAAALLREMRERRQQLAIVLDEHGGTAGLVTFDDLIEELIGEVFGEIHATTPPWIQRDPDGTAVVRGDVPIRELNRELKLDLPEGPSFSTVGGLCMSLAEGVPRPGEVLRAEDGTEIVVQQASERTVEFVRIKPGSVET
jgi:putative hemolysin